MEQAKKELEIIVVDDGSSDRTGNIADAYALLDARIRVFHKENGGATSARLYGAMRAEGDYIGFVDGDDTIEKDMYEHLFKNAIAYEADISHCGYQMIFPNGKKRKYYGTGKRVIQDQKKGLFDLIHATEIEPAVVTKLYKRELVEQLILDGKMDGHFKIHEDMLMNFYLFQKSKKAIYEDICLYHYQIRKGSAAMTKRTIHNLKDPVEVTMRILEEAKGEDVALFFLAKERWLQQMINICALPESSLGRKERIYQRQIKRQLRAEIKQVLLEKQIGKKVRIKAGCVSLFPKSYRLIHRIYAKMTGIDRAYEIE